MTRFHVRVPLFAFCAVMANVCGLQATAALHKPRECLNCERCMRRPLPAEQEREIYKEIARQAQASQALLAEEGAERVDVVQALTPRGLCSNKESVHFATPTHGLLKVASAGENITLYDGSVWAIRDADREKVTHWELSTARVTFTPNSLSLWAKLKKKQMLYKYRIVNVQTGEEAQANLALGSLVRNDNTLRIRRFDKKSGELMFTNGTLWRLDTSKISAKVYSSWRNGDVVITGTNSSWFGLWSKNIIINVNSDTWLPAQRLS